MCGGWLEGVLAGGAGDWALVPTLPQMDIVGQLFKVLTWVANQREVRGREGCFIRAAQTCKEDTAEKLVSHH